MGLFNKRDETPEIAPAPMLPTFSKREERVSELPSIPANSSNDNLNEEIIKSAMNDDTSTSEEDDENEEAYRPHSIPMPPRTPPKTPINGQPQAETIFVKIEKFNTSLDSLREIEERLTDLSADMATLREIKTKELKELNLWDEELKQINSRLSKIDSNIFGEV